MVSPQPQEPQALVPPLVDAAHPHDPRGFFVYADPGRMKSTFAASFPKPMLVLALDPSPKLDPYRRRGKRGATIVYDGTPIEFVMSSRQPGCAAIQIEQYYDTDYSDARHLFAWERFVARLPSIHEDCQNNTWATVVLDSVSTLELCVRKYEQYKNNPISNQGNKQDARQWYNSSGAAIQEVCYNLGWLPNTNVVVLAHVRMHQDRVREHILWSPEMPGSYSRRVPGLFGEIYTIHFDPTAEQFERRYFLQTNNNGEYVAATQIPAPDGAVPHYNELWAYEQPIEQD